MSSLNLFSLFDSSSRLAVTNSPFMMPDEVRIKFRPWFSLIKLGHIFLMWRSSSVRCGSPPTLLCFTVFYVASCPQPEEPPKKTPPPPRQPVPLPTVDGQSGQLDVVSRLLKDRILLLGSEVNDEVANVLVAQLLYLANEDPNKDITLYINSPGGSVSAGLAIYDTMQFIPCDVQTVCFGMAASMGAFLLGAGTKGKRKSLPNARIMIHQVR